MVNFRDGVNHYLKNQSSILSGRVGDKYIDDINDKITELVKSINDYKGTKTQVDQLKGNAAEDWHAGTLNINATLNGEKSAAYVPKSNEYASVDIKVGEQNYGLKYYNTASDSAKAQAISHFEMYKKAYPNNEISFETFLKDRNIKEVDVMNDPIYNGQMRVIPSDQLLEAKEWLKLKIEKEQLTRPEQVKRYQDTYDKLTSIIEDNKGNKSIELTKNDAEELARLGKEGKFDAKDFNLTTEELVKLEHLFKQSFKAGMTAATISMSIKVAPEVYNALLYLLKTGEIKEEQFEKIGYAALEGGSEGFLRGFVSASIVASCESGMMGSALKGVDPSIVGAVVVLTINTMKNATEVARGRMTREELVNELIKEMFITAGAMSLGTLTQGLIQIPVLGFMIGSFAGSLVGTFVYDTGYSKAMSFFVENGFTMFGLVDQDYELPKEVLHEIGIETFEHEKMNNEISEKNTFEADKFSFNTFDAERFNPDIFEIKYLRRGVIGINKIGYVA